MKQNVEKSKFRFSVKFEQSTFQGKNMPTLQRNSHEHSLDSPKSKGPTVESMNTNYAPIKQNQKGKLRSIYHAADRKNPNISITPHNQNFHKQEKIVPLPTVNNNPIILSILIQDNIKQGYPQEWYWMIPILPRNRKSRKPCIQNMGNSPKNKNKNVTKNKAEVTV